MTYRRRLQFIRSLFVAALLVGVSTLGLSVAPAASAAAYCGIHWGSLPKSGTGAGADDILAVRAGRHTCYDRLVIDLRKGASTYRVEYVPVVYQDPSGEPVDLAGGARLHIVLSGMVFASGAGAVTHPLLMPNVTGFRTFREVVLAGSFEGVTSFGLGVRARLPFRAFLLAGPGTNSRLVIDVAHRW
jgi:hypothetical protein